MRHIENCNLLKHNTFGIHASCRDFVEFDREQELKDILHSQKISLDRLLIIGAGSNLLLTEDFAGCVIHSHILGYDAEKRGNDIFVRVGSGENWDALVETAVNNAWYGAENLSLIPGEVGASAIQNIGAYGAEVKDLIYGVEAVEIETGQTVRFSNAECEYAYRQSRFKKDWKNKFMITYVTYKFSSIFIPRIDYGNIEAELERMNVTQATAKDVRTAVISIRRSKLPDPEIEGNAGSFFMNPIVEKTKYLHLLSDYPDIPHYMVDKDRVKIPAGWMIEQCGWKGRSMGAAGVHSKQALVLVNKGGATGEDILHLSDAICRDVKEKFGIEISPEVNII